MALWCLHTQCMLQSQHSYRCTCILVSFKVALKTRKYNTHFSVIHLDVINIYSLYTEACGSMNGVTSMACSCFLVSDACCRSIYNPLIGLVNSTNLKESKLTSFYPRTGTTLMKIKPNKKNSILFAP